MKERNSNIEILRIVSMLMIIGHHYIYYGVMQNYDSLIANLVYNQGSFTNKLIAETLLPGGVVGVGIFFAIMGYFGIQSDEVKLPSVFKDTLFYSITGLIIYLSLGMVKLVELHNLKKAIISCINPVSNSAYWFASVYILLALMKPAINQFIGKLNTRRLLCFSALILCYYLVARFNSAYYLGIINGLVFYIIGAFIKLNEDEVCKKIYRFIWLGLGIAGWILYVIFNNSTLFGIHRGTGLLSLLGICIWGTLSVIGLLMFCISKDTFSNKLINIVASSTFSVYLIHEHPLLRETIWSKVLHVESIQWNSSIFVLYAILSIIIVFIVCVLVDKIRKKILDKIIYHF